MYYCPKCEKDVEDNHMIHHHKRMVDVAVIRNKLTPIDSDYIGTGLGIGCILGPIVSVFYITVYISKYDDWHGKVDDKTWNIFKEGCMALIGEKKDERSKKN